ncbi:MAG: 3-dehydroquinate synthase [Candidatus Dormibacteraeota bacterium]|uniref:Shikimate kinase n=1 Tax=Candidatus Aeolococcus gillhamiae TaxID=3127015 RepID=A0A2W5Z7C1_9BACT|nr:3-dehydroquinate synthase [Candidatus Dormibacteraeota bacterium]PZR81239.1 MAG: 3-dehydroquinate synthase [Candidatus Dormibacter sp. RRmetagenome_bin12]
MTELGHVVLVGLPGCGKSTVAPLLAQRLGRAFFDTDADVEARLGMSCARVFAELGEPRFRAEERRSAEAALGSAQPLVIAAGGGLIAQHGAIDVLARRATVICLDAADAELVARVGAQAEGRPRLGDSPGTALPHLRAMRAGAHALAQLHVPTEGRIPEQVAEAIAMALTGAVRVGTARPYLVRVGTGILEDVAGHVPHGTRRVALVADEAVAAVAETVAVQLRRQGLSATVFAVRGGEHAKQWSTAGALLEQCSDAGLDRDDCIIAVGGGSVGDVAGLVAATYLRGIAWVVVPTTLLAMVDSAVGGKTAVNLHRGKNLAGVFWQPRAVLCDPDVLAGLGDRSFRSAFAEIVKSSMVGDGHLAEVVDRRLPAALGRDREALTELIRACCALKAEVVAGDERESGRRAILNYGHTVGHAVEALTGLGAGLDHGEAVAFGMRVAGALSVVEAACPAADVRHQDEILDACGLSQRPRLVAADIADQLGVDKKARGGVARWVLLRGRGEPVTGIVVEPDAVRTALSQALAA